MPTIEFDYNDQHYTVNALSEFDSSMINGVVLDLVETIHGEYEKAPITQKTLALRYVSMRIATLIDGKSHKFYQGADVEGFEWFVGAISSDSAFASQWHDAYKEANLKQDSPLSVESEQTAESES